MKVVIQRVSEASVSVEGNITGKIGRGLMILVGIEESDSESDIEYLTKKIVNLRIFDDSQGVMNISLLDTGGEILLVSQFTLHAQTKKGNRPSYIKAARPETAIPIYEKFKKSLALASGKEVKSGIFGAEMKVSLVNDGPVTIIIDTKEEK
jgi:D-tyrosyl-tRNA(Tyr) deacylase